MPTHTSTPRNPELQRAISPAVEFLLGRKLMVFVVIGLVTGVALWATSQSVALAVTAYLVLGVVIFVTAVDMVRDLMRGHWGLDILAVVAMIATLEIGRASCREWV